MRRSRAAGSARRGSWRWKRRCCSNWRRQWHQQQQQRRRSAVVDLLCRGRGVGRRGDGGFPRGGRRLLHRRLASELGRPCFGPGLASLFDRAWGSARLGPAAARERRRKRKQWRQRRKKGQNISGRLGPDPSGLRGLHPGVRGRPRGLLLGPHGLVPRRPFAVGREAADPRVGVEAARGAQRRRAVGRGGAVGGDWWRRKRVC